MREYTSPAPAEPPASGNLTDDVVRNAADDPEGVAFSTRSSDGWVDVTWARFHEQVRAVAKGLIASGVDPGDRVALLARNSYEWTLVDYAVWFCGAVTVPVYETSPAELVEWILGDAGASAFVAGTGGALRGVSDSAGSGCADRRWSLADGAVQLLTELGRTVADEDLERRRTAATPGTLATIIYTSGTTGSPKGCALTHGNFLVGPGVAVEDLGELFDVEGASTLLFLPLTHVFARVVQVGAVRARVRLGHSPDAKQLLEDLASFRPTFILGVPRVLEMLFNTLSQEAAASGRGGTFDRAAETAIAFSRASDGHRPGVTLRARHALFDRLVYGRLREALGGRCRYAISGGAPLGERLGHFYRGAGLTVLEGYGLTETTGPLTVNVPDASRMGTVGRPLAGATVRIADDGELLVRGGQVFGGYWDDPAATEEVLSPDGWLHTGDLGEIDDEGFVRVTGRKNEIIVTAGGKVVSPTPLEDRIRAHPLVSQCMVVGDGRPFVTALVTIDTDSVSAWAGQRGKSGDVSRLTDDADLLAEVQAAVDDANRAVSQAESIRKFAILPVDWTEESGHLTPSLKLRRNVVMREFRLDVEHLYTP